MDRNDMKHEFFFGKLFSRNLRGQRKRDNRFRKAIFSFSSFFGGVLEKGDLLYITSYSIPGSGNFSFSLSLSLSFHI